MPPRLSSVVGKLTLVNLLTAATGFITGPLLAHGLGAHGRGDLAAVIVPLGLVPHLIGIALASYANREIARGRPLDEVLGSAGAPLLLIGALAAACAFPAAAFLAEGRETVRICLVVVFLTMPIWLIGNLLIGALQGLERWHRLILARTLSFAVPTVGIVVMFATGTLTVEGAAALTVLGNLLSIGPAVSLLFEQGRPVFRKAVARAALIFGFKSWGGGLAYLANLRLDSFVMITAVAPRELGLYTVATTLSAVSTLLTGAVAPPLMARVAAGQTYLLPQAVRLTLAATALLNVLLAPLVPFILLLFFGREFLDATGMTLVLLAATLPLAGGSVLAIGLQAHGAPGIPSIAEVMALAITFSGLALLLGPLGGLGAALVSLAAYSASFVFQLVAVSRRLPAPAREYLMPTRADARWAWELSARLPGRSALSARRRRTV